MLRKLLLIPALLVVAAFALATAIDLVLAGSLAVGWVREAVAGNSGGGGNTVSQDVFWSALVGGGAALSVWVLLRAARVLRAWWNGESGVGLAAFAATLCAGALALVIQVWTYGIAYLSG
jgi:hypothetical protein